MVNYQLTVGTVQVDLKRETREYLWISSMQSDTVNNRNLIPLRGVDNASNFTRPLYKIETKVKLEKLR